MALLVKGDVRLLELDDGGRIALPPGWSQVHDPTGHKIPACTILVLQYTYPDDGGPPLTQSELREAEIYFGTAYIPTRVGVDIPSEPWIMVGHVRAISYARRGRHRGNKRHAFKVPVPLHAQPSRSAFRISLPQGCVLDARGYVWP